MFREMIGKFVEGKKNRGVVQEQERVVEQERLGEERKEREKSF